MDETMTLIDRAHQGDKEARDQLVLDNMGLIQIGSIGLIKAIDKFDLSYEVRFSTYAVPMICGEIKRFIRDDGMIKVSRSLKEMGMRARAARETMTYALGREPTVEEIARELGASKEEVAASLARCPG